MRIRLCTHLGGGFDKEVEIPGGTTVGELCLRESLNPDFDALLIQVKRQVVEPTYRLTDGDSVVMTPRGIRAAHQSEEPDETGRSLEDIADFEAIELAERTADWIPWEQLKAELGL